MQFLILSEIILFVYWLSHFYFISLTTLTLFQKDYQNTEEVCQLRTLVNNLQELVTLHRKYNCKLTLSDFEKVSLELSEFFLYHSWYDSCLYSCCLSFGIQEDTATIVFRMFDKVLAPELIPSILEKFISVYMKEHDLQEEELLLLYIEVTFSLVFSWTYAVYHYIKC